MSSERATDAVSRIRSGMVGIRSFALAVPQAPFGGIEASGMGRDGGSEGTADRCNAKLGRVARP